MLKGPVWLINKYATPKKYPRHFGMGKALVDQGIDTTLICSVSNSVAPEDPPQFKGWKKVEYHEGLRVIWLNGPKISNNGLVRVLSWFWFELKVILTMWRDKSKPEAILSSSLSILSVWSGWILARRHGARFSFEVRDIWPLSLIELGGYSSGHPLVRFLSFTEKFGYKRANVIIGTMPNLAEHVGGLNPEWTDKTICVPQGVDTAIFNENSQSLPKEFIEAYIPEGKFIVAYAGTLNSNNPIDTLIEAASELAESHPQIHFIILGKGENREKYIGETSQLSNISFPPAIPKQQMAHFLSFVDVGYDAFSSTLAKYGLSRNKWIDYMYNACVIVCSYDGYQSMINEVDAGYFVEYGNAKALKLKLVEIYGLPKKQLDEMSSRAKKYIEEERSFTRLANSYKKYL